MSNGFYRKYFKRILDLSMVVILLILLAPLLLFIALLVYMQMGSPVLFRQARAGLNNKPFVLVKFRTMTDVRGQDGKLLPDAKRLTRFGKFLRSTSLDELPGLWNVFRGEMSLVGPRPLLLEYLLHYTPQQIRRHEVRPGVTGWAAVKGRNALSWEDKFKLDVWYVDNLAFWLDIKIIFLTVWTIVRREGVTETGNVTTGNFGEEASYRQSVLEEK